MSCAMTKIAAAGAVAFTAVAVPGAFAKKAEAKANFKKHVLEERHDLDIALSEVGLHRAARAIDLREELEPDQMSPLGLQGLAHGLYQAGNPLVRRGRTHFAALVERALRPSTEHALADYYKSELAMVALYTTGMYSTVNNVIQRSDGADKRDEAATKFLAKHGKVLWRMLHAFKYNGADRPLGSYARGALAPEEMSAALKPWNRKPLLRCNRHSTIEDAAKRVKKLCDWPADPRAQAALPRDAAGFAVVKTKRLSPHTFDKFLSTSTNTKECNPFFYGAVQYEYHWSDAQGPVEPSNDAEINFFPAHVEGVSVAPQEREVVFPPFTTGTQFQCKVKTDEDKGKTVIKEVRIGIEFTKDSFLSTAATNGDTFYRREEARRTENGELVAVAVSRVADKAYTRGGRNSTVECGPRGCPGAQSKEDIVAQYAREEELFLLAARAPSELAVFTLKMLYRVVGRYILHVKRADWASGKPAESPYACRANTEACQVHNYLESSGRLKETASGLNVSNTNSMNSSNPALRREDGHEYAMRRAIQVMDGADAEDPYVGDRVAAELAGNFQEYAEMLEAILYALRFVPAPHQKLETRTWPFDKIGAFPGRTKQRESKREKVARARTWISAGSTNPFRGKAFRDSTGGRLQCFLPGSNEFSNPWVGARVPVIGHASGSIGGNSLGAIQEVCNVVLTQDAEYVARLRDPKQLLFHLAFANAAERVAAQDAFRAARGPAFDVNSPAASRQIVTFFRAAAGTMSLAMREFHSLAELTAGVALYCDDVHNGNQKDGVLKSNGCSLFHHAGGDFAKENTCDNGRDCNLHQVNPTKWLQIGAEQYLRPLVAKGSYQAQFARRSHCMQACIAESDQCRQCA